MTESFAHWYALCARSRHEQQMDRPLVRRGIDSFLPLRDVLSRWKDRRKRVEKPPPSTAICVCC